jgi:hypothetical protein
MARTLRGVALTTEMAQADLIWDLRDGDLLSASGDTVMRFGALRTPALVQGVVNKWRFIKAVGPIARKGPLSIRLNTGGRIVRRGERTRLTVTGFDDGELALFDLASDGSVVAIRNEAADREGFSVRRGTPFSIELAPGPPFGADHLFAVAGEGAAAVRNLLTHVHGRPFNESVLRDLVGLFRDRAIHVSYASVHTAR